MKNLIFLLMLACILCVIGVTCESTKDPYEPGMHWDYSIHCENGFVYKMKYRTAIQVFNSDGTPLRCGQKIY
jgi:hypothetical protein